MMLALILALVGALVCVQILHRAFNLQVIVTAIACGYLVGSASDPLQLQDVLGSGNDPLFRSAFVGLVQNIALFVLMATAGACMPFENMQGREIYLVVRLVAGAGVSFIASCVVFMALLQIPQLGDVFDIGARNVFEATLIISLCTFVTSLPFLTKIFQSLNLLNTRLSRNVLLSSCVGDLIVYVATAIFVALATATEGWASEVVSHVAQIAAFLTVFVVLFRMRTTRPPSHEVWLLPGLGVLILVGTILDVGPLLTGMFAGLYFGERGWNWLMRQGRPAQLVNQMGTLYFVFVGLALTTQLQFSVLQFVMFLTFSSTIKIMSVFACIVHPLKNAKLACSYAMAMNTRGGPGIVLASIFFTEGMIGQAFFVTLITTSIVTAMMTEVFLKRTERSTLVETI